MTNVESAGPGLREMTRRAVRAQISETAMAMFVARGFDETTVDEIATAVGISSRSVFRYFPSKEDMVIGNLEKIGESLVESLEARPPKESPWVALRYAMDKHLADLNNDDGTLLATSVMLSNTPTLQAALANKRTSWVDSLVPNVTRRVQGPARVRELQARAITSAAMACLNTAVDEWTRSGGSKRVDKLLDQAIEAVRK